MKLIQGSTMFDHSGLKSEIERLNTAIKGMDKTNRLLAKLLIGCKIIERCNVIIDLCINDIMHKDMLGDVIFFNGFIDSDNKLIVGYDATSQFKLFLKQLLRFNYADNFYRKRKGGWILCDYSKVYYDFNSVDKLDPKRFYIDSNLDNFCNLYRHEGFKYGDFVLKLTYSIDYQDRTWDKPRVPTERYIGRKVQLTVDKGNTFKNVNGSRVGAALPSDLNYGMAQDRSCLPDVFGKRFQSAEIIDLSETSLNIDLSKSRSKQSLNEFVSIRVGIEERKSEVLVIPGKGVSIKTPRVDRSKLAFKGKQKVKAKINWGSSPAKLTPTDWKSRLFNTSVNNGLSSYYLEYIQSSDTVFYVSRDTSYPVCKVLGSIDSDGLPSTELHWFVGFDSDATFSICRNALSFLGYSDKEDLEYWEKVEKQDNIRLGFKNEASTNVQAPEVKLAARFPIQDVSQYQNELAQTRKDKELATHKAKSMQGRLNKEKSVKVVRLGNVLAK
jgi:hypothetical protein